MDFIILAIGVGVLALAGVLAKVRFLTQVGIGAVTIMAIVKYWELMKQQPDAADIVFGYLIASVVGFCFRLYCCEEAEIPRFHVVFM